jgi:anti-sigma factor RsiW
MRADAERELAEDQRLVDYLLGRLDEGARAEIERRLFLEEELNDELLATVDELLHAYLAGVLTADDRARVESELLTSARHRERMDFVRDTAHAAQRLPVEDIRDPATLVESRRWPRGSRVLRTCAALLLLVIAGALYKSTSRVAMAPPLPTPSMAALPTATATVPLAGSNDTDRRTIRLPPGSDTAVNVALGSATRVVRLELTVPERPSYDVMLHAANGVAIWSARGVPPVDVGEVLVLTIPAAVFRSGRHTLRLVGESLRDAPQPSLVTEYRLDVTRER